MVVALACVSSLAGVAVASVAGAVSQSTAETMPDIVFERTTYDGIDTTPRTSQIMRLSPGTPSGSLTAIVTTPGDQPNHDPVVSPDGRQIAFVASRIGADLHTTMSLTIMNIDGSSARRLVDSACGIGHPRWSPDGSQLAYVLRICSSATFIYRVNADGSDVTVDTPAGTALTGFEMNAGGNDSGPAWSPDGRKIVYLGSNEPFIMNADGSNWHLLTTDPNGRLDGRPTGFPAWSPDGKRIYLTNRYTDGTGTGVFYYTSPDSFSTSNTTRLLLTAEASPDGVNVSSTGNALVYGSCDGCQGVGSRIFTMGIDGTAPIQVTSAANVDDWSPSFVNTPTPTPPPTSTSSPSPPSPSTTPTPTPGGAYVALGDSYSSGEGLSPYLAGSTFPALNQCHRSSRAYGPQLATYRGLAGGEFTFAACSGAVTDDFFTPNPSNLGEPAQVDQLGDGTTQLTLTVGGNDAGFPEVLGDCVVGYGSSGSLGCSSRWDTATRARIDAFGGRGSATTPSGRPIHSLTEIIERIHSRAKNATIYVANYPLLFGSEKKALQTYDASHKVCVVGTADLVGPVKAVWSVDSGDMSWMNDMATLLDRRIIDAVTAERKLGRPVVYADVTQTFRGHGLCDRLSPWINGVVPNADRSGPSSSTFHPTADGQTLGYKAAFVKAKF
jgi:GDSL-like Lipase/Acylhydrolase family/WD40-like Beta Propeller Repeat